MGTKNAYDKASGGSAGVDYGPDTPADPSGGNQSPAIRPDMANPGNRPKESQVVSNSRKKEEKFYVYYLRRPDKEDPFEPGRGCPFYVGKGCDRRVNSHKGEAKQLLHKPGKKPYKISIIHSLWKRGLDFERDIVFDNLNEQEAFETEIEAIQAYGRKDNGTGILANMTDGGDGNSGLIHSDDSKEKMRQANLGKQLTTETKEKLRQASLVRKPSVETIKKISQANSGKKPSPESIEKNRQAHLGKKASLETKEKIRQGNLGKKRSSETIEKIRQNAIGNTIWKGKKHKPETKEKLRQSKLGEKNPNYKAASWEGKKHSPETKEKIRQTKTGQKHKPESIEKIRQASILYWKRKRGKNV
jgi:hypothetical protein